MLPLVWEANISAEELKRKITFKPVLSQQIKEEIGMSPLEEL